MITVLFFSCTHSTVGLRYLCQNVKHGWLLQQGYNPFGFENHAIANTFKDGTDSKQQVAHFLELTGFVLATRKRSGHQAQPNKMDYPRITSMIMIL